MELLNLRYQDERRVRSRADGIGRTGTEGPGPRRGARWAYVALVAGARWGWARAERAAQVSYAREDPVSLPPPGVGVLAVCVGGARRADESGLPPRRPGGGSRRRRGRGGRGRGRRCGGPRRRGPG